MEALSQTKKKERRFYDLSEVEDFLLKYERWYKEHFNADGTADVDSNPDEPPPPPPGHNP